MRIGGGPSTIQQYLRAGLVDVMHVATAPVLVGDGERLFDHLGGGSPGYVCAEFVGSPAVLHARLVKASATSQAE